MRKDRGAGPSISLGKIAESLAPTAKTLGDRDPGLSAEGWFKVEHQVYPYGSHVAVVRVDGETGGVTVERYYIAYDIGRAINPALVEGADRRRLRARARRRAVRGVHLQRARRSARRHLRRLSAAGGARDADARRTAHEDYATPRNPLGIKGAGESGITGVGAAIASAIDDAIGIPGAVTQLPVTPQRLKQLLAKR